MLDETKYKTKPLTFLGDCELAQLEFKPGYIPTFNIDASPEERTPQGIGKHLRQCMASPATVDWWIKLIQLVVVDAPHPLAREYLLEMDQQDFISLLNYAFLHMRRNMALAAKTEDKEAKNSQSA